MYLTGYLQSGLKEEFVFTKYCLNCWGSHIGLLVIYAERMKQQLFVHQLGKLTIYFMLQNLFLINSTCMVHTHIERYRLVIKYKPILTCKVKVVYNPFQIVSCTVNTASPWRRPWRRLGAKALKKVMASSSSV